MNKKKIILTVLGVIVLLVVSVFIFNKRTTPPAPGSLEQPAVNTAPTNIPKNTVIYQDGSFYPANFSVKAGTTVSFVNNSNDGMWLASNPHPLHTSLPAFNTERAYGKGEIYKFTFTLKGAFGYHNHLNPTSRGTFTIN